MRGIGAMDCFVAFAPRNDDRNKPCLRALKRSSNRKRACSWDGICCCGLLGVPFPILALIYAFGGLH
jgi:hypothetical protein